MQLVFEFATPGPADVQTVFDFEAVGVGVSDALLDLLDAVDAAASDPLLTLLPA